LKEERIVWISFRLIFWKWKEKLKSQLFLIEILIVDHFNECYYCAFPLPWLRPAGLLVLTQSVPFDWLVVILFLLAYWFGCAIELGSRSDYLFVAYFILSMYSVAGIPFGVGFLLIRFKKGARVIAFLVSSRLLYSELRIVIFQFEKICKIKFSHELFPLAVFGNLQSLSNRDPFDRIIFSEYQKKGAIVISFYFSARLFNIEYGTVGFSVENEILYEIHYKQIPLAVLVPLNRARISDTIEPKNPLVSPKKEQGLSPDCFPID
jgi:hypothetical protein